MHRYLERIEILAGAEWLFRGEFRALCAALTAFLVALVAGSWWIPVLRRAQLLDSPQKGDSERLDRIHAHKASTPTLGGVILLSAILVSVLLWARLDSRAVLLLLGLLIVFGALGFADDWVKLKTRRKGMSARLKLSVQTLVALGVACVLYAAPPEVRHPGVTGNAATALFIPLADGFCLQMGLGSIVLSVLAIVGSSNAVNLTDGLDGLAAGSSAIVAVVFALVGCLAGSVEASSFLSIPHAVEAREVAVFAAAVAGAGLGFLWFNCHPARVFMGDTGSLPLGGVLGCIAVLCKQEVLLVVAGGVLVAEALSVILQVFAFKVWRRRLFLIAPLHHHFQFRGLGETEVTVRFWIAGALLALCSLAVLGV
jgi:phospho-N-acetylmuramoyl-pentapeptide-transferase